MLFYLQLDVSGIGGQKQSTEPDSQNLIDDNPRFTRSVKMPYLVGGNEFNSIAHNTNRIIYASLTPGQVHGEGEPESD